MGELLLVVLLSIPAAMLGAWIMSKILSRRD